jgi:hypothetical protein
MGSHQYFCSYTFRRTGIKAVRNVEVLRWCLHQALHVVQPMTLLSKGLYGPPAGAFLPSKLF